MKKLHQILQITLLVYFGAFLIFFIAFDTLGGLFGMEEITSDFMVTLFLVGLIFFLLSWAGSYMASKKQADTIKRMESEMNALKARLYDLEHPKSAEPRAVPSSSPTPTPPKTLDPDHSSIPPRQNFTNK